MTETFQFERRRVVVELGEYLSLKEASHLISRSEKWIRNRVGKEGGPVYQRIGNRVRFPTEEFIRWMKQPTIP